MAASIGVRPSLLKTWYLQRNICVLCHRSQSTSATDVARSKHGGESDGQMGGDSRSIPRGQINIPRRKKRDSLSILKALASTVRRDPTAPAYSFMDDPFLIPSTPRQQKLALLSKASGKRTAHYIVNEFSNTFDHDAAVPHVPAFQPDNEGYQHTDVTVETLAERIERRAVEDAIEVYERMKEEGIDVPDDLKLAFLELLCVFSCKNPPPVVMPEEKVVDDLLENNQDKPSKLSMDLADDLFQTLSEKTADAYNWIVRGLLKVGDSKGLIYYKEMIAAKVPVYLGTYNELINSVCLQSKMKWKDTQTYLTEMKRHGVAPNLDTFHSVLRVMASTSKTPEQNLRGKVPSVLAEMKMLNIEPTLHTWSLVLSALQTDTGDKGRETFNKGQGIMTDILDIIDHLRANVDQVYTDHVKENFFLRAMRECKRYRDSETAIALFELKEDLANRYTITSLSDEIFFYDDLLTLLARTEIPDVLMDIYSKVCPNHHSVGRNCLFAILSNLDMYKEYRYVLQLWDDVNPELRMTHMEKTIIQFLEVFVSEHVQPEVGKDFAKIAKKLYDDRLQMETSAISDGLLFTQLITIFLNNGELDNAWEAMTTFVKKEYTGFIRYDKLVSILEMSIQEKDVPKIMSFCELPETMRSTMLQKGAELIKYNKEVLTQLLEKEQLQLLEECFPSID